MLPDLWNFSHIENTAPVVHRKSIHSVVRGVMALHLLQMERLVVQQLTLLYSRHSDRCSTKPFLTTLRAVGHWQVEMLPSSASCAARPTAGSTPFVELGHNAPYSPLS